MSKKRKTRQQKIIAELRRKLTLQQNPTFTAVSAGKQDKPLQQKIHPHQETFTKSPSSINSIQISASVQAKTSLAAAENSYAYLAKDLKKVVFLTGLAILAQLVLYWALR